jgi:hypothetical protein
MHRWSMKRTRLYDAYDRCSQSLILPFISESVGRSTSLCRLV